MCRVVSISRGVMWLWGRGRKTEGSPISLDSTTRYPSIQSIPKPPSTNHQPTLSSCDMGRSRADSGPSSSPGSQRFFTRFCI